MSYATPTQFGLYGLPTAALDGLDPQDYLDGAFGEINTYLRGRYALPIVTIPIELVRAECVIATYDFLSFRGFDPEAGADKNVWMRYRAVKKWLHAIADGKINLDIAADSTPVYNDGGPLVSSRVRDSADVFREAE